MRAGRLRLYIAHTKCSISSQDDGVGLELQVTKVPRCSTKGKPAAERVPYLSVGNPEIY